VVVIAAGYEVEMQRFIAANSGLSSRLSHRVRFDDYTTDELITIASQHAAAARYEFSGSAVAARSHPMNCANQTRPRCRCVDLEWRPEYPRSPASSC
jgi:hypothetical protein